MMELVFMLTGAKMEMELQILKNEVENIGGKINIEF